MTQATSAPNPRGSDAVFVPPSGEVHPIELESYRILAERLDLSAWAPGPAAVIARIVHATADVDFAKTMVIAESGVQAGIEALQRGAPVIADVKMTRDGITAASAVTYLDTAHDSYFDSRASGLTRSAAAMRHASRVHPHGAIFVIGCAPTALFELVDLVLAGLVDPALVIGLPVGFVGAAESKEALRLCADASKLSTISNTGERGGAAVAAAAINAIGRLASNG